MNNNKHGARNARALPVVMVFGVLLGAWFVSAEAASAQGEAFGDPVGSRRGSVSLRGRHRYQLVPDVYVVRRGDTLWDLTHRYYGNPYEWPRVWSYNPEITNPHWIYPDDRVRLRPGNGEQIEASAGGAPVAPRIRGDQTIWLREQGYLDVDALRTSGQIVGSEEEHLMLSPSDALYVSFAEGVDVQEGVEMTVFRHVPEEERELNGKGQLVRVYGTVRIDRYNEDRRLARAVVVEALSPIERGFRVANVQQRFTMAPLVESDRDLTAEVVAALRHREILGEHQIIFVNAGTEEGVQLGNQFVLLRGRDEWIESLPMGEMRAGASAPDTPRLRTHPNEVIAEARVVSLRPHSSTLLVTSSLREVLLGDRAELREGE